MLPEYHEEIRNNELVLICDDCGAERGVGDWPQCPHIPGNFGEEPLEPYVDENIDTEPVLITTRGQRRAIMAAKGFEYRKKRTDLLPGRASYFFVGKGK